MKHTDYFAFYALLTAFNTRGLFQWTLHFELIKYKFTTKRPLNLHNGNVSNI